MVRRQRSLSPGPPRRPRLRDLQLGHDYPDPHRAWWRARHVEQPELHLYAGRRCWPSASQAFDIVNFDPSLTVTYKINGVSPTTTATTITGGYAPVVTPWLSYVAAGDSVTLSILSNVTNAFDPGSYTTSFIVTPQSGDNAGVSQTIKVTLNITGTIDANTSFGSGVPMTTTNLGCSTLTACNFTVINGSSFSDGSTTETIEIPILSVVPTTVPCVPGRINFDGSVADTSGGIAFASLGEVGPYPNGGSACGGTVTAGSPATASSNACYITITIPASDFANSLNGTVYVNTLSLSVSGLTNPDQTATETGLVTLPPSIKFTVTVANNALLLTGSTSMSTPVGPTGNTTITDLDTLNSKYLATTQSVPYNVVAGPAPAGFTCSGVTPSGMIPNLIFTNNGVLPAANAGSTTIPFNVAVANPGTADQPGTYATQLTITATNPPLNQSVSPVYCLTVGNIVNVTITTPDLPTDLPPLYIEAGTSQTGANSSTLTVSAVGTLVPQPLPPGPVSVPISVAAQNVVSFVSLATSPACTSTLGASFNSSTGVGGSVSFCINTNPQLLTTAGEVDPSWLVTATGTLADATNGADQATVTPPLPVAPTTSATFVFRVQVTSGVTLEYYTDYSLFSDSATSPAGAGNLVTGATLLTEKGVPFALDPIASIGTGAPDFPGVPNSPYGQGLYLQFYTVQNSGGYTMQDGTPVTVPEDSFCGSPCQSVYIAASGPHRDCRTGSLTLQHRTASRP